MSVIEATDEAAAISQPDLHRRDGFAVDQIQLRRGPLLVGRWRVTGRSRRRRALRWRCSGYRRRRTAQHLALAVEGLQNKR